MHLATPKHINWVTKMMILLLLAGRALKLWTNTTMRIFMMNFAHLRVNMIMGIFSLILANQMMFFSLGKMGKKLLLRMGKPILQL